jgi:hypothetical protein
MVDRDVRRWRTARWVAMAVVVTLGVVAAFVYVSVGGKPANAAYGRIALPGSAVVHLPQGSVRLTYSAQNGDRAGLTIPVVPVTATAVGSGPDAVYHHHLGKVTTDNGDDVAQLGTLDVPRSGDYRVSMRGDFTGAGITPELQLGHSVRRSTVTILMITGLLVIVIYALSLIPELRAARRR